MTGKPRNDDWQIRARPAPARLRLAVLLSGSGRTLANLLDRIRHGAVSATIELVISSRSDVPGVEIAGSAGLPVQVIRRNDFDSPQAHRDAVFSACRQHQIELVVMAGYLQHLLIVEDFRGRVINIHPSILPKYCGQGFYGLRVHQAVLDAGERTTGCTVHYVDDQYDHGPIIATRTVSVQPADTAEALAARVFEQECALLPAVIQRFATGELELG